MALSGKFISFEPIIESVYRRAGYQTIDWTEAVEVVGETIRLIAALPAYEDITTNGQGDNPIPLEVEDYRVILPNDLITLKTIRKVALKEIDDGDGGTELVISGFLPMVETTDMFYQSPTAMWETSIPSGSYDYTAFKQRDTLTLSGASGTADITAAGGLTKTVTFSSSLSTSASNFVTTNAAAYLVEDIVITNETGSEDIVFTANTSGTPFTSPVITTTSGDLTGSVSTTTWQEPLIVVTPDYQRPSEYVNSYKVNNNYIYTNFKEGFIELVYTGFVKDASGYPMIPDDQRYIEAIKWSLIEHIDYKKWRVGDISDRVYDKSEREKMWAIGSAKTKADIPTVDQMESMKEMFLRSIIKTRRHDIYFKYGNLPEMRYTKR